ncbi:hypothetical protein [Pelagicoccus sp. SDUM812002]|uniref:hypothetical protein n=1 Tax=Pelagicoccus sp. SDUM812002 TaxID=3041266 RepID=UPI00280E73DB|nr:hypothetical protein [Pelagicoccus sp. SDUM812002]MDQ8184561.1 hypothetical protein [Pelagicoccus sp. SDUM812002]
MRKPTLLLAVFLICLATLSLADDLSPLSDEFENAASLSNWSRVFRTEGWGADQMQSIDVSESRSGYLTMIPKTSSWYRDWRGILMYKQVSGDFVATIDVEPRNRALDGAPGSSYSLAGIMARTPRSSISQPSDWTASGENYIFLSLGTGNNPGHYQFEVKSTVNSSSSLEIDDGAPRAIIQVVRLGEVFLVLRKLEDGDWEVHRRYRRSDMPNTLQVGVTVYTDWGPVELMDPFEHNQTSIDGYNPDLNAAIDYFRFKRPRVPSALADLDFTDPLGVPDSQIIGLFGDRANRDPSALAVVDVEITGKDYTPGLGLAVEFESVPGVFYRIEKSEDLKAWTFVEDAEAVAGRLSFLVPDEDESSALFLRVAED